MKPSRLVVLAAQSDMPAHAISIDGQGPARSVLAVPAEQVHVAWLALPSRTPVQARAAARALLATRLATAPEALHVAVSDAADAAGMRLVVALDPAVMAGWVARARELDFTPDVMVPDCLLLPQPVPGAGKPVQVLPIDGRWLARGEGVAFAADPALAETLLGDLPRTMIDPSDGGALLARGALSPPVNLLQGDFGRQPARSSAARRLRWLAVAVALMPLLMPATSAARHGWAAHVLAKTAAAEAAEVLGVAVDDPIAATDARVAAIHAPQALPHALAALAGAIATRPGMHLETVRFHAGEGLVVRIAHGGPADIAALDAAIRESGLVLGIVEEGRAADGRQRSDLRVEAAQ